MPLFIVSWMDKPDSLDVRMAALEILSNNLHAEDRLRNL